jgi:hypothetical protein
VDRWPREGQRAEGNGRDWGFTICDIADLKFQIAEGTANSDRIGTKRELYDSFTEDNKENEAQNESEPNQHQTKVKKMEAKIRCFQLLATWQWRSIAFGKRFG